MFLLIAGGAIAVAAIAVAVIVLSNSGGSNKKQSTTTPPQPAVAAAANYKSQVAKALGPLVSANRRLSSTLNSLDGSKRATRHAKGTASQATTALSTARGGIQVLSAPAGVGNLSSQVQQVLTADGGYLQAVSSTLQTPSVSGAGQLDTLATGAQTAFDGIASVVPNATSSVAGNGNLESWAQGAARTHKSKATAQTSTSTSTSAAPSATPAPASPAPSPTPPSGTDCGGGLIAGPATSCPFAENVQAAWEDTPGESATVNAYSPVTGQSYVENCSPDGDLIFCTDSDASNSIWFPS